MKSEERRKLKENELAEFFGDELEFLRRHWQKHGTLVLAVVLLLLAIIIGGSWMIREMKRSEQMRASRLQNLIVKSSKLQHDAAGQQSEAAAPLMGSYATSASTLVSDLGELYEQKKDSPVGMMALMQQAEAVRSELFFADSKISDTEKETLCSRAETLYNKIKNQYPSQPQAVGTAKFGLALLAEERGQWDEAARLYQEISRDSQLEGTAFPLMASKRLHVLDDFKNTVEFVPVPKTVGNGETDSDEAPENVGDAGVPTVPDMPDETSETAETENADN